MVDNPEYVANEWNERAMRRTLIAVVAVAIAATACSGTSVFELDVGDCFDDPSNFEEVTNVGVVECTETHDNEVYANLTVPSGSFPGINAMQENADEMCHGDFNTYVGMAWEESELDYGWLHPTEESWDDGDRIVTCFLYDGNLDKLTGSMKNSGV
jgi:hypothetical protein